MLNRLIKNPLVNKATTLLVALFMAASLTGCEGKWTKYEGAFDGLFDTHCDMVGYARSISEFNRYADRFYEVMTEYDKLFDIYNNYDGLNNLKTVNDNAGADPVEVDHRVIDLILYCKQIYDITGGAVNVAMGPVLSIWHKYREEANANPANARIPTSMELYGQSELMDISFVQIDRESSAIFLALKGMSLDVGAIAKGYATYQAVEEMKKIGMTNMLINMGGNIISIGKPQDGARARWGVGVQDPRLSVDGANNILDTIYVNDIAVVSSGDYQRYYMVGGKRMHHIIDPETLFPASRYTSVTVVHPDSALADGLSTALFIMDEEEGKALALEYGAEALWVYADGQTQYTNGYKTISKTYGGYSATDPESLEATE